MANSEKESLALDFSKSILKGKATLKFLKMYQIIISSYMEEDEVG